MGDDARIGLFLGAVRRRLRLRQAAGGLAITAGLYGAALLGLLLVVGGTAAGDGARWAFVGLGAAGLAGAAWSLVRPLRRFRRDEPIARLVGDAAGEGDGVLSAVELARSLPGLDDNPAATSPGLARAHLAETARRLAGIEPHRIAPLVPSRRRLVAAGLITLGYLGLMAATAPRLQRALELLRQRSATVVPTSSEPIVGDIEIGLTFPAYSGLPPRVTPGSSGEVLALPGTEVVVRARPLVRMASARCQLEDGDGQVLEERPVILAGGRMETRFTVGSAGGGYRFVLERSRLAGKALRRPAREPEAHPIAIEADHPPTVALTAASEELELDAARPIELHWSAEDDFGLSEVELWWEGSGAGGAGPTRNHQLLRRVEGADKGASGLFLWDLPALALPPGARLTYHVEARDNDTVSGGNLGRSRTLSVRIHSPADRHDELLVAQQGFIDHAVEVLGDRLEATRGAPPAEPLARALVAAHARTEDLLGDLARLRALVDTDPLAPRDLGPALAGVGARIGRLARDEKPAIEAFTARPAVETLRRAAESADGRHQRELEKDIIALDDLLGRQRIEQLLSVTDQMQQGRDRLRALLADFKKSGSDALKQQIEREIRALEQKLAELADKAQRLAADVPDEFVNREALGDNGIRARLEALRTLLDKGQVDAAMEELKRVSRMIDRLDSGLESDLRNYRGDRFSAADKALAELENQVSDLEHDERQLQEETAAVRAREREEARRIGRERVEPFLRRARDRAADIKRRLGTVERDQFPSYAQDDFDRIKREAEALGAALDQGDLEEAGEAARKAAQLMRGFSLSLRGEEARRWTGARASLQRSRDKVDETAPLAQQLADDIDRLTPRPSELLGPSERQKLQSLAERQQALRRRTDELRGELSRRGQGGHGGAPAASGAGGAPESEGDQPEAGLGRVGEHMERAGNALRAGNPRDSLGEESQAADELARMRRSLQNERRPRSEGGAGSAASSEPVRIPGSDEFRAPRAFRQDLLEAMKREAPREFREQVKRYYEELVK